MDVDSGVRTYKGEAQVMADGTPRPLREGRELQFDAGNTIAKFDPKQGDPLFRWANRRAEYIAMANIASANMASKNYGSSMSMYPSSGGWFYNSFYGMMTYLPLGNGLYRSPFGYSYYSPIRVGNYYRSYMQAAMPQAGPSSASMAGSSNRSWNSQNGYYTTQSRSAGAVSMPASSGGAAASAASAPAARGADVGAARGGGSGRGGR
jgi:hypothetical protein